MQKPVLKMNLNKPSVEFRRVNMHICISEMWFGYMSVFTTQNYVEFERVAKRNGKENDRQWGRKEVEFETPFIYRSGLAAACGYKCLPSFFNLSCTTDLYNIMTIYIYIWSDIVLLNTYIKIIMHYIYCYKKL